ncbi:MAG TPA: hypothetical protein ENH95_02935 [Nitrosopumilus sp.]|nr:hypothetical protein [Nitrosopumilus sp.]
MDENNQQEEQPLTALDLNSLPDRKTTEKRPKPNLGGQEFTIQDVNLFIMPEEKLAKKGTKYKDVLFRVHYDQENYEHYGGVKAFKQNDGEYGPPVIYVEGSSAASQLFKLWLTKVGKTVDDVSFKEFFQGLKGLKVKIVSVATTFQGKGFQKNSIGSFL